MGVPDDSTALLATVLARSMQPDLEILVRVNETDATRKALSGGADYVLSVLRVSARMVARELRGEEIIAPATQIRLLRIPARPFSGETLADVGIYEKTGCRVIAVEDESGIRDTVDHPVGSPATSASRSSGPTRAVGHSGSGSMSRRPSRRHDSPEIGRLDGASHTAGGFGNPKVTTADTSER